MKPSDESPIKHLLPPITIRLILSLIHTPITHTILDSTSCLLPPSPIPRQLFTLAADIIASFCLYNLSFAILDSEREESEMENSGVVPGVLRPEWGWVFGWPSKIPLTADKTAATASAEGNETEQSPKRQRIISPQNLPLLISTIYLLNPISIISSSPRSVYDMLLLSSFYYAATSGGAKCAFLLAAATHGDGMYGVYLIPVLLWRGLWSHSSFDGKHGRKCDWKIVLGLYTVYYGGMYYILSGTNMVEMDGKLNDFAFVELDESGSFYGPNMSLHWYFFVQLFDRFRPYFTIFIHGIPLVFILPVTIRLHRYPSVLASAFQLLWSIFRPISTLHTLTLGLTLLLLNPRTLVRMQIRSLVALFAIPVPILLFVTFHDMWLVYGNGNPNYLFFQCFAHGLFVGAIVLDCVSATVKRDKVRRMMKKDIRKKTSENKDGVSHQQEEEEKEEETNREDTSSEEVVTEEPNVVFL